MASLRIARSTRPRNGIGTSSVGTAAIACLSKSCKRTMLLSVSTVRPEAQRFIAVMSAGDGPVVAVPEAALVDGGPIPNHDMVTADKTSHLRIGQNRLREV